MTMDGDEEEGDDDDVAALVMPCPGCFATSLCLLEEISYEFVAEPGEVMSQCLEVLKNEVGCPGNSVLATDSTEQQEAARHDCSVAHRHVRRVPTSEPARASDQHYRNHHKNRLLTISGLPEKTRQNAIHSSISKEKPAKTRVSARWPQENIVERVVL